MPGARDHLDSSERDVARAPRPDAGPARSERPAITGAADPRLADGSAGTRADLMHVQRTAGNAAVASLVAPAVQRVVAIDEVASEVAAPAEDTGASPVGDAAPEMDHTINAAHIGLNAPMVEAPGIIRANTVIADSIVASSYTPGAGNAW